MKQQLIIRGRMTSLNEYINAERTHRHEAAKIKKDETERVAWEAKAQKLVCFIHAVNISYQFFVDNDRTDEDNMLIYCKWIADGLVMAGVIYSDSRKWLHIKNITFHVKGREQKTIIDLDDGQIAA